MGKLVDHTGKRFGRLAVVERAANLRRRPAWFCQCDCGETSVVPSADLVSNATKSCGCLKMDNLRLRITKHGMSKGHMYLIWRGMLNRTTDPRQYGYEHYGGRGITVCDRWKNSLDAFIEDMGPRPSPEHSVDRIDNNKGYSSENCRWADRRTQGRNKRSNKMVTFNEKTRCLADWSEITGIHFSTLDYRIFRAGWDLERALTEPPNRGRKSISDTLEKPHAAGEMKCVRRRAI